MIKKYKGFNGIGISIINYKDGKEEKKRIKNIIEDDKKGERKEDVLDIDKDSDKSMDEINEIDECNNPSSNGNECFGGKKFFKVIGLIYGNNNNNNNKEEKEFTLSEKKKYNENGKLIEPSQKIEDKDRDSDKDNDRKYYEEYEIDDQRERYRYEKEMFEYNKMMKQVEEGLYERKEFSRNGHDHQYDYSYNSCYNYDYKKQWTMDNVSNDKNKKTGKNGERRKKARETA
ncbi:uncharacterized protein ASCRUDRAFT_75377, partial [Ascoidea rubescens DSM 1968]